jgi:hypothetical protein
MDHRHGDQQDKKQGSVYCDDDEQPLPLWGKKVAIKYLVNLSTQITVHTILAAAAAAEAAAAAVVTVAFVTVSVCVPFIAVVNCVVVVVVVVVVVMSSLAMVDLAPPASSVHGSALRVFWRDRATSNS